MRNYKIVCSDLDGTLLDNNAQISRENLLAIAKLHQKGIFFVPSTGRTFSEIPTQIKENPAIRYFIYSNGAVVFDRQTNESRLTCMTHRTVQNILAILNDCKAHITLRHNGNCYVDGAVSNEAAYEYYNVCQAHREVVNAYALHPADFGDFCAKVDDVEVISAFFNDLAELTQCKCRIEQLGGLRIVGVSEYNLEIMNVEAGKGNALLCLAEKLGVAPEDTISMGDSDNDNSIIQAAGLGLAVSNACEALKVNADAVICSNEEHAAAFVLNHYFENS